MYASNSAASKEQSPKPTGYTTTITYFYKKLIIKKDLWGLWKNASCDVWATGGIKSNYAIRFLSLQFFYAGGMLPIQRKKVTKT